MGNVFVTCLYCDDKYETYVYGQSDVETLKCRRCQDTNLKVGSLGNKDPFGYSNTIKEDAYIKKGDK